jgi:transaldolase
MEIYLDTAVVDEIRETAKLGIITGVTTNPSLMMKAGRGDYREVVQEVCFVVQGHISAEVTSIEADGMIAEAETIAQWSPHVVIKIPVTADGLRALSTLAKMGTDLEAVCKGCKWQRDCPIWPDEARALAEERGIATNATLAFSTNQGLLAALAGATYVSIFVGRLDDAGHDGMGVVKEVVQIFDDYGLESRVIAASIRHPLHIFQAARAGADIATVPYTVLMQAIKHPLTDAGLKRFLEDWAKVKK